MSNPNTKEEPPKLPSYAHAIAGWPLIMIIIGGALGGLCGGGAYGLSMALLKKKGVTPISCLLSFLIGIAGVGLYFIAIIGLAIAFPGTFGPKQ